MSEDAAARARILVVDDSSLMRKAVQKMLGGDFDVVTADDGLDAWAKLERDHSIQVVFSDLSMPRCDGYEFLKMVRSAEDTGIQNIPLIVVTGADNDESARKQAFDLGATDFITKPFTATTLLARAHAHAKYQRITRQLQEQSTLDPVTGLLNKPGFLVRFQQDISFARRHSQPLTLVCLEIDDFRKVFLQHGKPVAEGVVAAVARQIRSHMRKEDTAARVGLGGYALGFLAGDHDGIESMIGRLQAEIARTIQEVDDRQIRVTVSCAVVTPLLSADTEAKMVLDHSWEVLKENQTSQAEARAFAALVPGPADEIPQPKPAPKPEAKPDLKVEAKPQPPKAEIKPDIKPAAPVSAPPVVVAPGPAAIPALASVDTALEQIERGDTHGAIEKLPKILNRLQPLFRLLRPIQRERLIHFLQKLGTTTAKSHGSHKG